MEYYLGNGMEFLAVRFIGHGSRPWLKRHYDSQIILSSHELLFGKTVVMNTRDAHELSGLNYHCSKAKSWKPCMHFQF